LKPVKPFHENVDITTGKPLLHVYILCAIVNLQIPVTRGVSGVPIRWEINESKNYTEFDRQYKKGKGFPYSTPSVGPGANPGVQAVSPQVTISHPPGRRLPLLSARTAVTFLAAEHHRPLAGTKLCCLVTETHRCEQLAQGCYAALPRSRI